MFFFNLFHRFGIVTYFDIGARLGRRSYPREEHGIEMPLFGWVEVEEPAEAEAIAAPVTAPAIEAPARAAQLHSVG